MYIYVYMYVICMRPLLFRYNSMIISNIISCINMYLLEIESYGG